MEKNECSKDPITCVYSELLKRIASAFPAAAAGLASDYDKNESLR
jgi:hypothetical protein